MSSDQFTPGPAPRRRLTRPVLVIAVDDDHAFVAFTAWQEGKAARVRDALRARHPGLRFHCAPSWPERWQNREAQLFADRIATEAADG